MKTKVFLTTCITWLSALIALGQGTPAKTEQFNFQKANMLKIDNSFGDVNISTYSGSTIDIRVEIVLDIKNSADKQKVLDKINILTSDHSGTVTVSTENKINGMNSVRSFEINYTVKIPKGVALDVRNQFGDVVLGDIHETLQVQVQHGNCSVNSATGKANRFKVQFGDLRIESAPNAKIEVQHGDMRAGGLGDIFLDQKFGDSHVRTLSGRNEISIQHGDLTVEQLQSDLNTLTVDAQFSSVKLGNITGNSYLMKLDGNFSNFTWEKVLKSSKGGITIISEQKEMNRNKLELSSNGQSTPANTITINASHSDVELH